MSKHKRRKIRKESRATKTTGLSPQTPEFWVDKMFGGGGSMSSAGVTINEDTALTASAFFCGVSLIADAVKSMPIGVFERADAQTRKEVVNHPAWLLLRLRPNPNTTPSRFKWWMITCRLIWGNGYAEIERTPLGVPANLWPIHPSRVTPRLAAGGEVMYEVTNNDGPMIVVPARDMLHVMGFSKDGIEGVSSIRFGAEAMGLSIATERSASAFFGNGAQVPGVLQTPGDMSVKAMENLRDQWTTKMQGQDNWHKVAILKEGLEYKSIGIPPEDAQLIQSRTFSITDWARWLKIPPHKLKELSHATFTNIEQQNTEYFQDAILPELIEFEEECDRKLIGDTDSGRVFCKFNEHAILRADIATQTEHFTAMLDRGVYSINMVLGFLNMNGIGDDGDIHHIQGQMMDVSAGADDDNDDDDDTQDSDDNTDDGDSGERSLRPIVRDAFGRIAHKEIDRIRRGMKQCSGDVDEFRAWVHEFYRKHEVFVGQTLGPVCESIGGGCLAGIESRYVKLSRTELLCAMADAAGGEEYGAVNDLLSDWNETRADTACEELFRSLNDENRKQSVVSKAGAA